MNGRVEMGVQMKKRKKKKIDVLNYILYVFLIIAISGILTGVGLIDFIGNDTHIRIGSFHAALKLKLLLFPVLLELNAVFHEWIHFLTGKLLIPDAEFKVTFGGRLAQTERIGGDPTRVQNQIVTIMPFVILSVAAFFVGLAVADKTDLPMYFFLFNTAGSIKDIEVFLYLFCFPKQMAVSEIFKETVDGSSRYRRFWAKWDQFFSE